MEHRKLGRPRLTVRVVGMGAWSTFDVRGTVPRRTRAPRCDREARDLVARRSAAT